ncbi:MAG: hypothetical protein H6673_10745 [Anaerolineales bacterium]|nr:hypothetical protein [Anaerolineales bacterium]
MMALVVGMIVGLAVLFIVFGLLIEWRSTSRIMTESDPPLDFFDVEGVLQPTPRIHHFLGNIQTTIRTHPHRNMATIETVLWLLFVVPLIEHMLAPYHGFVARIAWFLTIGPHEVGHIICMPFGAFLYVLGGSIWQLLFWALLAGYERLKGRTIPALMMLMVVGHSFINLSVYIRDAQERELPLLFGLGKDHHDWGTLLDWMGLLAYDDFLAGVAVVMGVLVVLSTIGLGIAYTWRRTPSH